jgi:DNA modification methylase
MAKIDIKKTELVWLGKYDEDGKLVPVEKPGPYPFQIVEVINNPRTGKENPQPGLFETWKGDEGDTFEEGWKNKLIWGDNKLIMSSLLEKFAGKINLIYIDPPFATGADFKFKIQVGDEDEEIIKEHSVIEEKAYRDTWGRGLDSYLQMMYERLVLMKELLAENGSIYVHLDWHVGHYVKVMMDEIFGYENFRNEIVWKRMAGVKGNVKNGFPHLTDVVLFYSKSESIVFKAQYKPLDPEYVKKFYKYIDENGRLYRKAGGSRPDHYRYYLDESKGTPIGNLWDDITNVQAGSVEYTAFETQKPEALLKRIILASSNPGDLVADFFCGSGTTLVVAEKLGRRWIGCDLSRYAIHVTRKRLLEIENSKDLENEDKKYDRKARPFEILNLGKYERQLWQVKTFSNKDEKQALYEYLAFILKLYGAEPISGLSHVHGRKGSALIYVGAVDMPVTINDCIEAINDCKSLGQKELHVLGWEWEMGLNDAIQEIASKEGIKLKLRLIPMDVLDQEAVKRGDIQFFELAHFKAEIKQDSRKVLVELKDFVIPHTDLIPEDVKDKIKKWTDWIDYWAIDFDYRNDTFNNGWTSYRTKKDRKLSLKAEHKYEKPGKYKLFIKVIDIFGIDSSKIYEIEVK